VTERTNHLDPEERLRLVNPVPGPPCDAEIDAALQRLLARVPTAEASALKKAWPQSAMPRRIAFGGGVAATVAIAAFVVVNVLPGSQTPGSVSDAWAKRVIAHTVAAVAGPGSGILHIVETTTGTIKNTDSRHRFSYTDTYQSWDSQTTSDEFWSTNQDGSDNTTGPDTSALTLSGHTLETYDAASNTLHEVQHVPPARVVGLQEDGNAGYGAAVVLTREANVYPGATRTTVLAGGSSSSQVPTFSDLIVALLKAPGVTVDPNASVNGEPAISITARPEGNGLFTFYVKPQTYTPLQLVITETSNGSASTNTTTFNTYETLPAGSVTMPNLAQLHPNATTISTQIATDG
jgi:hypothetical protein